MSFDAAKKSGGDNAKTLLRKGEVGDWKNHLDEEHSEKFNKVFQERVGHLSIAKPLEQYM